MVVLVVWQVSSGVGVVFPADFVSMWGWYNMISVGMRLGGVSVLCGCCNIDF